MLTSSVVFARFANTVRSAVGLAGARIGLLSACLPHNLVFLPGRRVVISALLAWLGAISLAGAVYAQPLEVPASPGPTYEIYKSSRALIISASRYSDSQAWPILPESESDADRLEAYLGATGFSEIVRLRDEPGAKLREAIRTFLVSSPPNSRAIIYFAGHGATDQNDKRLGYIVPIDAPDPKKNLAGFKSSAISTIDLQAFAHMASAKHTLFIADSCFSGALIPSQGGYQSSLTGTFPPKERYWETVGQPRFQIISASENWERIPAKSKLVDRLIEGWSGAADSFGYGFTTAYNLSIWLRSKALDDEDGTNPLYSSISLYNPATGMTYAEGGDMVFAMSAPSLQQPIKANRLEPELAPRGEALLYKARAPQRPMPSSEVPPGSEVQPTGQQFTPVLRGITYQSSFLGTFDPSHVFGSLSVEYYKKIGDGLRVTTALDRLGVPYLAKPALIRYEVTNAIACHPDVNLDAFKAIAIGLIEEGVDIRLIKQYATPYPAGTDHKGLDPTLSRSDLIQVLSAAGGSFEKAAPIRVDQILALTGCPKWYQNAGQ